LSRQSAIRHSGIGDAGRCQVLARLRAKPLDRVIQPDSGMPSRCRPPASAPAHAAAAASKRAVALENARMVVLARARLIAALESEITASTRVAQCLATTLPSTLRLRQSSRPPGSLACGRSGRPVADQRQDIPADMSPTSRIPWAVRPAGSTAGVHGHEVRCATLTG
jgi:hypothetical protein